MVSLIAKAHLHAAASILSMLHALSAVPVDEMTRIQTGDLTCGFTPGNGWGLGWCVIREPQGVTANLSPGTFGHGGSNAGFRSRLVRRNRHFYRPGRSRRLCQGAGGLRCPHHDRSA